MSWWELLNIQREADQYAVDYRSRPPQACPNDGTPLISGPNEKLFCPFDGWTETDDPDWH